VVGTCSFAGISRGRREVRGRSPVGGLEAEGSGDEGQNSARAASNSSLMRKMTKKMRLMTMRKGEKLEHRSKGEGNGSLIISLLQVCAWSYDATLF
jgi:hypothetical protein